MNLTAEQAYRIWHPETCRCPVCETKRANASRVARIRAGVADGTYADADGKLDASLEPLGRDMGVVVVPDARDTRDDRAGEDEESFQSDFEVQNY